MPVTRFLTEFDASLFSKMEHYKAFCGIMQYFDCMLECMYGKFKLVNDKPSYSTFAKCQALTSKG